MAITDDKCDNFYNVELYLKLRGALPPDDNKEGLVDLAKEYISIMDACGFEELRKHGMIDIFAIYHHCKNIIRDYGG